MAEVADICTESTPVVSEVAEGHVDKGIEKSCDLATNIEVCGKGDTGPGTDEAVAVTKDGTPANAEVEMSSAEATADTTDGTPSGTKRKLEDEAVPEASDDLKKVKTGEPIKEADSNEADPKAIVNGDSTDNNGCHNVEGTNGKDVQDIPAEIVTKSVEETPAACNEDVVASS